jgi:Protein of unknown function (DUF2612)
MKIEESIYDINIFAALLWQYEESNNLRTLILNKNIWTALYGTIFWESWYFNVFDLRTANLFGLTVWSIILDLPLFVPISDPNPAAPVWGFNELPFPLTNNNLNFTHGNLAGALVVPNLTEDEQRIALQLKYYQLVSRGAVTEVNQFLNYLFGSSGGAWMIDNFDMTITYTFNFTISPVLLSVIASYELLPKPAGVNVNYVVL